MKKYFMALGLFIQIFTARAQPYNNTLYPVYKGNDLGLTWHPDYCLFRIWAPTAEKALLLIYTLGEGGAPLQKITMDHSQSGTWRSVVPGNQLGKFYTFQVLINGQWMLEVPDPYAKATGVNGLRAMVVDLRKTDPPGWQKDKMPEFLHPTAAIIYELHVRDATISSSSGIQPKGGYSGLTVTGTKNVAGQSTGLDHLKELGVTHIHLLPCFDYNSVDETDLKRPQYNWGYDPLNYNVPEGSYSSNPYDGNTRIREFKKLIQSFHQNGLRVIMDVVYNHTAKTENSNFNQLVPGYYYRQNADGKFSNATACGNETASERAMMRKFILESVKYWVEEYHVDGFRFDLMGVHDQATMNSISKELHAIRPGILIYGEGWTAGASPLPDSTRALKKYVYKLDRVAVFSDDIRDGIKGSVFEHKERGFASGRPGMEQSIRFGIVASCRHPQVDYSLVNYSKAPYASSPAQTITYCECHDNHTLWDKLAISAADANVEQRKQMQQLALSIVLTSQGIAFLHAGTEFLRSKKGVENSFNSPDSINAIDWDQKTVHKDVVTYVEQLIQMRKQHPAFHLNTAKSIVKNIYFLEKMPAGVVAYTINAAAVKDSWKKILVIFNGTGSVQSIPALKGNWEMIIQHNQFIQNITPSGSLINLNPYSCSLLVLQ